MATASPCFKAGEGPQPSERLFTLPLDDKIVWSKAAIMRFYVENGGNMGVSYSGGKDSTVLLHLTRSMYPDAPAVFFDTGLEFPEVRQFVKTVPNVEFVRPKDSFRKVILEEGYPVISKEVSKVVYNASNGAPHALMRMNLDSDTNRYGYSKWKFLLDAPFKISHNCCNRLKKRPAHDYQKANGNRGMLLGTRAAESELRMDVWKRTGGASKSNNTFAPLSIWTDKDVEDYIKLHQLPLPAIYGMGYARTGCMFCMFGITMDPNRFLRLKATHPKQWEYCMKPVERGGLGMREVCDYLGVPSGCEQTNLLQFATVIKDD